MLVWAPRTTGPTTASFRSDLQLRRNGLPGTAGDDTVSVQSVVDAPFGHRDSPRDLSWSPAVFVNRSDLAILLD